MYLGKKQKVEHSLGEGVVPQLSQKLNDTYCTLFFDNFFNSSSLVETLYQRGIYGISTVRKDRKHMPSMVPDKAMKRGDHEFQYSDKAISCKWFDNRAGHLLGSNVEGFDAVYQLFHDGRRVLLQRLMFRVLQWRKYTTMEWVKLTQWINILQPTDLIEDQDSDFM